MSIIKVISDTDPSKTWIFYQLLVILGTWTFACGILYTAYVVRFKVVPILEEILENQNNSCVYAKGEDRVKTLN